VTDEAIITDKAILLAIEREAFERWTASIAGVPGDAPRGDGWTLKHVVAHIAAWHRFAAERLAQLERGEDRRPAGPDAFNARVYEAADARRWDEVQAEADAARAAFLEAVEAAPPAVLETGEGLGAYSVGANGSFHYEEHMADFSPRD
jgi:hypothetical protein